jgi:hypothetical protein
MLHRPTFQTTERGSVSTVVWIRDETPAGIIVLSFGLITSQLHSRVRFFNFSEHQNILLYVLKETKYFQEVLKEKEKKTKTTGLYVRINTQTTGIDLYD